MPKKIVMTQETTELLPCPIKQAFLDKYYSSPLTDAEFDYVQQKDKEKLNPSFADFRNGWQAAYTRPTITEGLVEKVARAICKRRVVDAKCWADTAVPGAVERNWRHYQLDAEIAVAAIQQKPNGDVE
jgi:hypothetical protein